MGLYSNAKRVTYKLIFVILLFFILLWCSIFLYGLVYYLYIPAVAHIRPIYFQYDISCLGSACHFPSANVTLVTPGYNQLLARGQVYAVEISLDMPESERNIKQGMFMVKLDMLSQGGEVLRTSLRPAVLHYKSPLFRTIYTLFFSPALLAGTFEEKQIIIVSLFEDFEENSYRPTYFIHAEIQARYIEVYSAHVRIHAQFKGLRYYMYYWPIFSSFIGVSSNFFFLCIVTLVTVLRHLTVGTTGSGLYVPQRKISQPQKALLLKPRLSGKKLEESGQRAVSSSQLPTEPIILPLQQERGIEVLLGNTSELSVKGETRAARNDLKFKCSNHGELFSCVIPKEEEDFIKSIRRRNIVTS